MKRCLFAGFFLFLLLIFSGNASAYAEEQADAAGVDKLERALPDSARDIMEDGTVSENLSLDDAAEKVVAAVKSKMPNALREAVKTAFSLFGIAALCGICGAVPAGGTLGAKTPNYINLAGAAAITIISVSGIQSMMGLCLNALDEVAVFSKVLLPAVATAAAMGGMPMSGSAQCFATLLFSNFLITVINRVILPLIYAYIALIAANAALSNDLLKKTAAFIKWICSTALKLCLTLFVGYLGISGAVAGNADTFAVKTLKFAVSGTLPVVGSILADASDSMLAGAGMLKNSIGIYGMIAIVAICLMPLLTTGIHYFVYKATAALCAPVCSRELGELMEGIGDGFGIAFGMLGGCLTLFCISLSVAVAFLKPS